MSVFKTKYPRKTESSEEGVMFRTQGMPNPMQPFNDSVQPTTTPTEQSQLLASNYPHYDALSVVNLKNRSR